MKLTSKLHYYIVLHITIIIWGFTSILGKLISMTSTAIVIDRMVIAYLALASMLFFRKRLNSIIYLKANTVGKCML